MVDDNRTHEERGTAPREEEARLKATKKVTSESETITGDRTHEERGTAPREEEAKQKKLS
jgi:hypothetical protein